MSFAITCPGFYRQRNGGKAELFAERHGGRWYGLTGTGFMEWWDRTGIQRGSAGDFAGDIVSEWHEPPTPPDGFQLMPADYVGEKGLDQIWLTGNDSYWSTIEGDVSAERMDYLWPSHAPHYIASPIPKPFRISDHGCGVYECRDGSRAKVTQIDKSSYPWRGSTDRVSTASWTDCGAFTIGVPQHFDLVRYIGPLPSPQPERPPLGIKPRRINDEQRRDELLAAIRRFRDGKRKVPRDWYEELCDLLEREAQP
jgi:hypothetical protein